MGIMVGAQVSAEELLQRAWVVALPMRVPFRGITEREVLLIEGDQYWAEWAPFPEYGDAEAARWLRCTLEMLDPIAPTRQWVPVNATIPAVDVQQEPDRVPELLQRYPGCTTVKIKVAQQGQRLADDVARVTAVRQWYAEQGIDAQVRVDANGAWSVSEALEAITALTATGSLEYVEQPCASVAQLQQVREEVRRRGLPAGIAADELIRKASDPIAVVRADACDHAVVKAAPLGGPSKVAQVAAQVGEFGVPVTVSSALDSSVGMYAGLLAAANSAPEGGTVAAAGLATGSLFVHDAAEPRPIVAGQLEVTPRIPEHSRLEELAVSGTRRDWWLERLRRCCALAL